MYPGVVAWLREALAAEYGAKRSSVHDTHRVALWRFLEQENLADAFPDSQTYEIQVDVTGLVRVGRNHWSLVLVECKLREITLRDISQLLGYSRVAQPQAALIVSPDGASERMQTLLTQFQRTDVLEYASGRKIVVATWDATRGQIDYASVLPRGEHLWKKV